MYKTLKYVLSVGLFVIVCGAASNELISKVREAYPFISTSKVLCESYHNRLKKEASTIELLGYDAAYEMAMANHVSNPGTKLRYFNTGKRKLERLIEENASIVELRYIRYTIQKECPTFLDYHSNMAEDLKMIKKNMSKVSSEELKTQMNKLIEAEKK